MTEEQKDLLLKNICSRLPYGVKISIPDLWTQEREIEILDEIFKGDDGLYRVNSKGQCIEYIKPYLFPLSSMTEEQEKELNKVYSDEADLIAKHLKSDISGNVHTHRFNHQLSLNWYLKNHFDINGLIEMGLAIDCSNLNIY